MSILIGYFLSMANDTSALNSKWNVLFLDEMIIEVGERFSGKERDMGRKSLIALSEADRAMKVQEVILKAMSGQIKWYQAAKFWGPVIDRCDDGKGTGDPESTA